MIVGADVVNNVIAMMPPGSMESGTLGSRLTRETGYTSVTWTNARRRPAKMQDVMAAGGTLGEWWIWFELYQVGETTKPKLGDRWTDTEGVVWQIKHIDRKMMQLIHHCLCLKNK